MRFDPSKIRAISLDLNGTLLAPNPSVGVIYADVLKGFGYTLAPELLDPAFKASFKEVSAIWALHPERRMDKGFWKEVVDGTAADTEGWGAASDDMFDALYDTFAEGRRWTVRTGSFDFLDAIIERGLKIAYFSNTDERMHSVLEDTFLAEYADAVCFSSEIGYEKPHPEAFAAVQAKLDCAPVEILHLGDSLINDGRGAHKAGWQTALLKSPKTADQGFPTFIHFSEILDVL